MKAVIIFLRKLPALRTPPHPGVLYHYLLRLHAVVKTQNGDGLAELEVSPGNWLPLVP